MSLQTFSSYFFSVFIMNLSSWERKKMLPLFPGEDMSLRPESPQMDIMYSAASNLNISLKFLEIYAYVIMQRKKE